MADRLRELIDLITGSLDEAGVDGRALAQRAHFSRDHLDRLVAAATGETPVAMRRRLLLERAAWQLRAGAATAGEAAAAAGYGSPAAFSRAFKRAYGVAPAAFAADTARTVVLDAVNGVHFHAPAGLRLPGRRAPGATGPSTGPDLTERLVRHHLQRVRDLLAAAATLPPEALVVRARPGFVVHALEGEEATAAVMAQRLVFTLELWVAAMAGEVCPSPPAADGRDLALRFERAAVAFTRLARRVRDDGAWEDAFVNALCEPPRTFTYGGVLAHVLSFGAVRREALAAVLSELGADVPDSADPILWQA